MAYAVDIEEVYHADHELVDVGVLDTYEIKLDVAGEKDFQITTPEPVLQADGFWYIPDTEFGGKVGAFESNSDQMSVTYTGRSWRGILACHFVDADHGGRLMRGELKDCAEELITESGLDGLYVLDDPDVHSSIDTEVSYTIPMATTLYDALTGMAQSIECNFVYAFRSDRKVHLTPVLRQDYTDYLKASNIVDTGFKIAVNNDVPNHLIIEGEDDERVWRKIHLFTDENGGIQPYTSVETPYEDSDYILDKSQQVLFGVDEISEYIESGGGGTEKYKPLDTAPNDWEQTFASYYTHNIETQEDGSVKESYDQVVAEGGDFYTLQTKQPSDWTTNYRNYFTKSIDAETGEESYSAVSPSSEPDVSTAKEVPAQPSDWGGNYGDYYYKFQTGTGIELRTWQGVEKSKYVKLTKKPSDWNTNFSSYYRRVYEKITYTDKKKKTGKKVTLVDCLSRKDAKWVSVAANDDGKEKEYPSFSKRNHYGRDNYTVPPVFEKGKVFTARTKEVTPSWSAGTYYTRGEDYHAPIFEPKRFYRLTVDHYEGMVEDGIKEFEQQKKTKSQTMMMDDFEVVIGDYVGGKDEYTDTPMHEPVSNIEITIENGLLKAEYIVGDL